MEGHKLCYFENFIRRTNVSVLTYVKAMQDLEERARNCYAKPINDLNSKDFVEMMLLDSCFIVEFIKKYEKKSLRDKSDPIFEMNHITMGIIMDLLLLEKQLPFFVLDKVFKMTKINLEDSINMAICAFQVLLPSSKLSSVSIQEIQNVEIKHLLGLMHHCWCFPYTKTLSRRNVQDANIYGTINQNVQDSIVKLQIEHVTSFSCRHNGDNRYYLIKEGKYIKIVTELQEFGIKFKRSNSRKLFDIRFKKGTIHIPPLRVQVDTEPILRSLVANKQCLPNNSSHPRYFTNYVMFMDDLIDSSKDVETLRHQKIILHALGLDEVVLKIFNRHCLEVFVSANFLYKDIYAQLNKHCARKRNHQMVNLRQNYYNDPWAFISVLAAIILLLLTGCRLFFLFLFVTEGDKMACCF